MIKSSSLLLLIIFLSACNPGVKHEINDEILASLGNKHKNEWLQLAEEYRNQVSEDPSNAEALLGFSETKIIIYIFGFLSREETLPEAREAFHEAWKIDSLSSGALTLSGMFNLLDWKWDETEVSLLKAIEADPGNLNARHWYSLHLSAMLRFDEAMAQSDIISGMDPEGNYMIGKGSLLYFARRFEEMKDLMIEAVAMDPTVGWGYDWLGMAYIELEEYENSVNTYFKAFELSDGTVEVGAGLGHALGLAGYYDQAKHMADFYSEAAEENYLPPVQRAFIHIGIEEYDEAIRLLEQAYNEDSWFLAFIQAEPWYDPIRGDKRFNEIISRMGFPE